MVSEGYGRGGFLGSEVLEDAAIPRALDIVQAVGDCFVAGSLAGLSMSWHLKRTAKLANAAGAACVTAMGATTGVRSLEETAAIMGTNRA